MKRNPNYFLQGTADLLVIVPVGRAASDFPGMLTVNETGALLWELLELDQTEETLSAALQECFDALPKQISADVAQFLQQLRLAGALVE